MVRQLMERERRVPAAAREAGPTPLRSGGWGPADITAIIELTRRPPTPQLVLPIVGHTARTASPQPVDDALGPLSMPVGTLRLVPPVLTPAPPDLRASWFADFRRSEAASILGFAAAWVTTTAAGALAIGHLIAGAQAPIVVHVPEVPAVAESQAPMAACPPTWEPPVVALADLPLARPAGAVPPRRPIDRLSTRSPETTAASSAPSRRSASPRRHGAPAAAKAKTAPPPKSLEDWMKLSVGGGSTSGS